MSKAKKSLSFFFPGKKAFLIGKTEWAMPSLKDQRAKSNNLHMEPDHEPLYVEVFNCPMNILVSMSLQCVLSENGKPFSTIKLRGNLKNLIMTFHL